MDFDTELAKEIRSFFDHERVLGLLNAFSGGASTLPFIAQWLKVSIRYDVASDEVLTRKHRTILDTERSCPLQ